MSSRRYQPVWERLKVEHSVRIEADSCHHRTIKRMLSKEKDQDVAWKLVQQVKNTGPVLRFSSVGNILTVQLAFTKLGGLSL